MYPWFNLASARDMAGRAVVPPRGTFILGPPVRTQSFHRRNTNPTHPAPSRAPDQPLIVSKFESISKQNNITTLNWGKGGVQVLFEMSVTGRVFFWRTRSSGHWWCQTECYYVVGTHFGIGGAHINPLPGNPKYRHPEPLLTNGLK